MINKIEYILAQFPGRTFNSGGKLHARCPFHDDKSPSFSITQEGLFICGSSRCGVSGGFELFYKLCEGITSWGEVKDRLGGAAPAAEFDALRLFDDDDLHNRLNTHVHAYPHNVEPIGTLDFFVERGFSQEEITHVCALYGLAYGCRGVCEDVNIEGTIVAPVYDLDGRYRTFMVRYLNPTMKKRWQHPLNSPVHDLLYGGWLVREAQTVWIVEGASDVWNLARFGIQAVALSTKSATTAQKQQILSLYRKYDIQCVVCLDGDTHSHYEAYGPDLCLTLNSEIIAFGIPSQIVYLEKHEDPGSLSRDRIQEICQETQIECGICSSNC
jgi:DNA primase